MEVYQMKRIHDVIREVFESSFVCLMKCFIGVNPYRWKRYIWNHDVNRIKSKK